MILDVSKVCSASFFRANDPENEDNSIVRNIGSSSPSDRVTLQNTRMFTNTAVRTSNVVIIYRFLGYRGVKYFGDGFLSCEAVLFGRWYEHFAGKYCLRVKDRRP